MNICINRNWHVIRLNRHIIIDNQFDLWMTINNESNTPLISTPRARTSVATRTSKMPSRKSFRMSSRSSWDLPECIARTLWIEPVSSIMIPITITKRLGNVVDRVLGITEDDNRIFAFIKNLFIEQFHELHTFSNLFIFCSGFTKRMICSISEFTAWDSSPIVITIGDRKKEVAIASTVRDIVAENLGHCRGWEWIHCCCTIFVSISVLCWNLVIDLIIILRLQQTSHAWEHSIQLVR